MRIAIQGGRASFHDMAARQFFDGEQIELVECDTFRREFVELADSRVDFVVMAIENTLAGSLLPNYALLEEFNAKVVGETYLQIKQNLMALPGQSLAQIHTVRSHPIALQQCSEFLESHPHLRGVESHDTADSAREVRVEGMKGVAAIASLRAAGLYRLTVLAESIENIKDNYTRFWIIALNSNAEEITGEKASVVFHVKHEVGALVAVLNTFKAHGVNLGLIQSVPIPGRPDEYAFHVDVEWSERTGFKAAYEEIKRVTRHLHILGEYKAGEKPYASPVG